MIFAVMLVVLFLIFIILRRRDAEPLVEGAMLVVYYFQSSFTIQ